MANPKAKTEPKAKGIREPAFLARQPAIFYDPISLNSSQWRSLVGRAPVVRSCIQTLIMQITGLEWRVESEDENAAKYFDNLLRNADDGAGFEDMISRVVEDTLTVPFGGAWEIGSFSDQTVAWVAHLDASLMKPVYQYKFPYAQVSPWSGPLDFVLFKRDEVSRIKWQPQTDIRYYGWTKTPCMDCLPAIQGLLRSDRFWQTMLTDSPPPGILEIFGMSEEDAVEWLDSWKTMLAGVDALKVPILASADRGADVGPSHFISFGRSAEETNLGELVRRYAEQVCASFGMNTSDLGLFGQEMRLAGMTKVIELSKRQGLAHLLKRIKQSLDRDVLSEGCAFIWEDIELEDTLRRETARHISAKRLRELVDGYIMHPEEARAQAVAEGLITVELMMGQPSRPGPHEPSGDKGVGTKGDLVEESALAPPKARALPQQGDSEYIPPRAFPTASPAARKMGKLVGPWMNSIAHSFTPARVSALLGAGLEASEALGMEGATATVRVRTPSPAEQAIEALLANTDWWRAPDISARVSTILAQAYEEGLLESAQGIQASLYKHGLATSPRVATTAMRLTHQGTLDALNERAFGLIRHIDEGTDFFVRREIVAGVKRGIGSPEIARKILVNDVRRGILETFRGRSLSVVNTEINWAETKATIRQQQEVGLEMRVWNAVPGIACEICLRNQDRGPVGPGEMFESVWGDVEGPPAHPKVCHCWIDFDMEELREVAGASGEPEYYTGD